MESKITNMIPVSELEDFYYESCEDYHLWDETEDGSYPVQRILDAMGKFLKKKQEIKLEDVFNDEKRQAIKEFIDKQEI